MPNPNSRQSNVSSASSRASDEEKEFLRPLNEDDDLYDPFSDRPPSPEPLFEKDPW